MDWHSDFFFPARINYNDLSAEVTKGLHLTCIEHAAGRREKSWWQSSSFAGRDFGKRAGPTADTGGIPRPACSSLQSNPRNLVAEEKPSVCAVFAVSPDNYEPTSASPGSLHVCFGRRNAPTQEKVGEIQCRAACSSQGL